jgi:hypothetical protein
MIISLDSPGCVPLLTAEFPRDKSSSVRSADKSGTLESSKDEVNTEESIILIILWISCGGVIITEVIAKNYHACHAGYG